MSFLHIRKDIAYEIASNIINTREQLVQSMATETSLSSTITERKFMSDMYINEENDRDDTSISSGIITSEDSDTVIHKNDDDVKNQNNHSDATREKQNNSSNSQSNMMNRITIYLSKVDWRVFNYITKYFLQNGMPLLSIEHECLLK